MVLNFSLSALFNNMQDWKGMEEKVGEDKSGKAYIGNDNDESSQWMLHKCACVCVHACKVGKNE